MNKDKVYLKGYVVGRAADTLGYHGLMVQLENLDIVEIDKNLVHKEIDEPQKVTVPQFVADWIEECKNDDFHLFGAMEAISFNRKKLDYWFREDDNMEIFARAWLDGYEIEKEKRYLVKIKGNVSENILVFGLVTQVYFFSKDNRNSKCRQTTHTRKELERSGFGWMFDCPGIEIEEAAERH